MSNSSGWSDRLAARLPADERGRALVAALGFATAGATVAAVIAGGFLVLTDWRAVAELDPATWGIALGLPAAAGLGAAAVGGSLWWLLVERPDEPTRLRGAAVGVAVGVLAHPLMWLLFGLGAGAAAASARGVTRVPPFEPADVSALLGAYLLFTVVGFVLTGIVTVPVAAGTGVALARVRRRVPDPHERLPRHL